MFVTNWLSKIDRSLFYFINKKLNYAPLDQLMLLLREAFTWIPLYLFFLLFFYFNCRKYLLPIVLLSALTFAVTDFGSASIIKPLVGRLRPCRDPAINFEIMNLAGCGGIYSMPSSHASNHFGLATFWFLTIRKLLNRNWYWLFIWAFFIGFAQVYVGVHFPGDIIVGAAFGTAVAILSSSFLKVKSQNNIADATV